ncbi:MAG: adenosylcobinamide-GDP ribazoletransferase [Marinifilaceae bacterium]|jgi:adenosylcobinamide-GDP ribazoletransferase|nr:adenosylcobinamide-GDP ribazoletransferase [Marinifilaceae bacterium]
MIKKIHDELVCFAVSVMFYSRIPMPRIKNYKDDYARNSIRYFPLVGYIVSLISVFVFYLCNLVFSIELALLFSMISMILTTGAFHEDSFADFCDAFGGGYTKEKILDIMKDSTNGTYGTVGLIALLSCKFLLLREIGQDLIFVIIVGNVLPRINSVFLSKSLTYVSKKETAKSTAIVKTIGVDSVVIASLIAYSSLLLIDYKYIIPILVTQFISFFLFQSYVKKKIGGYTGDVLGALFQISELMFYLIYLVLKNADLFS